MNIYENTSTERRPFSQLLLSTARYYLASRTAKVVLAATVLGASFYFNWGWLVAAGLAPFVLAMLPCGVMCAMGLCMKGKANPSAGSDVQSKGTNATAGQILPLQLTANDGEPANMKNAKNSRKGCC